jgi:integrase
MALRWDDVDLANGVIRVERAYDEKAHIEIEPKSRAGRRTVPIVGALRDILVEHKANQAQADGLLFGSGAPFQPSNVWRRAQRAWKRAVLQPIGLRRSRRRTTSMASSCPVPRPKRQPSSTPTSPAQTPPRASNRSGRREVDLFDFPDVLMGRIQLRW